MECPSCGSRVSRRAATCAVCGNDLQPRATAELAQPAPTFKLNPEFVPVLPEVPTPVQHAVRETQIDGTVRARAGWSGGRPASAPLWSAGRGQLAVAPALEPEIGRCPGCSSELEEGARFCSYCGGSVAGLEDDMPAAGDAPRGEASAADVDDSPAMPQALDTVVTPPHLIARDTLELVADRPRREPNLTDRLPGWVPKGLLAFLRDLDPRIVAISFASVALLAAILAHLFAPSSVPGFSPAEANLQTHILAAEWLLAGILVALIGLLAKR
jgi:hypothetical protein